MVDVSLIPPEDVEEFRAEVVRLLEQALETGLSSDQSVCVAVSGGPDSMALLLLAAAAFPDNVYAATVDHGLRPEAGDEAAMVAEVAAALRVPHRTITIKEAPSGASQQRWAREVRYRALTQWASELGVYPVLTAHHADDQAETLLMRLNRASGIAGLSGIRPWRFNGKCLIVRPLLGWRRGRLRRMVERAGIPFVDDPSNHDERHDRSGYRRFLLEQDLLDPAALARSAMWLVEAEQAVSMLESEAWADRWDERARTLDLAGLPREVRRRLVRRGVLDIRELAGIVVPVFDRATNVESLLNAIDGGRGATQAGVQIIWQRDQIWHFRPAPPRRSR